MILKLRWYLIVLFQVYSGYADAVIEQFMAEMYNKRKNICIESVISAVNEQNAQLVLNAMCGAEVRPPKFGEELGNEAYEERDRIVARVARRAVECGADVNINIDNEYFPSLLLIAASQGLYSTVELLAKAGADVNITGEKWQRTALYIIISLNSPLASRTKAVKTLLECGADPDEAPPQCYYRPPLFYAIIYKNYELVRALLFAGANPYINLGNRTGHRKDMTTFTYTTMYEYIISEDDDRMLKLVEEADAVFHRHSLRNDNK